ncbi:hypothetical protein HNQ39_002533 [Armatimonas rosea]|uniref:Uncharacterized protein n=1 Tax=Armatimonas rosea TaxID=685828 RepID=A0A7W9SQ20_ARMRO|nr:hypothetical protein [Armatimonas rosea]
MNDTIPLLAFFAFTNAGIVKIIIYLLVYSGPIYLIAKSLVRIIKAYKSRLDSPISDFILSTLVIIACFSIHYFLMKDENIGWFLKF